MWPIFSIKWIVLIESCCEFCSYQPNIQFGRTVWPNFYYVLGLAQMTEPFLQNTEPFFFIIFQNGYLRSFKLDRKMKLLFEDLGFRFLCICSVLNSKTPLWLVTRVLSQAETIITVECTFCQSEQIQKKYNYFN